MTVVTTHLEVPSAVGPEPVPAVAGVTRGLTAVRAYVALTKPRIIELLLVTTVPTMLLAGHGRVSAWLAVATLGGGTLAAGSANTLNCYLDRDIDAVMGRTRRRPLVTHEVSPRGALVFGVGLGVLAAAVLAATVNPLAAELAVAAIAFYVLVYTLGLKRRSPSNIVWGGAAGCMPVLIGWSAVTGRVGLPALVLFAVIFFWTPPHFWALAAHFRSDYLAAQVPMLPVVATAENVANRIVGYSWVMVTTSLLLWPVAHTGLVYAAGATVLGGGFLREAHGLRARTRAGLESRSMRLFHASISYLTLLFLLVAVDSVIRLPL